jgi:hypothetical protein
VAEADALDELHHEEHEVAFDAEVEEIDDVRMAQARQRAGLAVEPETELLFNREGSGEDLEGDVAGGALLAAR